MQLATQQWVAFNLGETQIAVPGTEVAFVVPIADYLAQEGHSSALLQYAGKEFPVYSLNKHFNLAAGTPNGRFCVCLGSAQQTPFVLVVDTLVQHLFDQHVLLGEIPQVMRRAERACPVFAVAEVEQSLLLLCTAASLAATIHQQLSEVEKQAEAEYE